jgi:hypothetical protein
VQGKSNCLLTTCTLTHSRRCTSLPTANASRTRRPLPNHRRHLSTNTSTKLSISRMLATCTPYQSILAVSYRARRFPVIQLHFLAGTDNMAEKSAGGADSAPLSPDQHMPKNVTSQPRVTTTLSPEFGDKVCAYICTRAHTCMHSRATHDGARGRCAIGPTVVVCVDASAR